MIYTHVAAALLAALIAFTGGWKVQGWRLGEQITQIKAAQLEAVNVATREARATESRRFKELQDAQAAAQIRAQTARRDAESARAVAGSLRDALNATRGGLPGEPAAACIQRADTSGELLAQCAGEITELAGQADRLHADRMMILEAWPK